MMGIRMARKLLGLETWQPVGNACCSQTPVVDDLEQTQLT